MEFWLLVVIGILLIIIFSLVIKLFFVHKTVREIEAQFTERLMTETNTLIDISHRNKIMCGFAKRLNTELRKLRKERHRFQQGDLELKNAVTNISHDLRTPLTAISGYLDLLDNAEKSEEAERYIKVIRNRTEVLRQLTEELLLPDFEAAERIADRLSQIGNICSDGRPTLRIDCRDLLELALDECGNSIYIPAHIWTPHFSVFGEFSGFETPDECFGDMTSYVYAMETGLSSDPLMNRRVSVLDDYRLISNSDAHSPGNLGREATLFDVELSYRGIAEAIRTGNGLCGTIEFFPQEGKYHLDGHRKCGVCFTPEETKVHGGVCPVCGRAVTVGVAHRIEEMADRSEEEAKSAAGKEPFESLIPLKEVIAMANGSAVKGKRTEREYMRLLVQLGPEFEVLRKIPVEQISRTAGEQTGCLVDKLRKGKIKWNSGFDGEYGTIDPGVIQ